MGRLMILACGLLAVVGLSGCMAAARLNAQAARDHAQAASDVRAAAQLELRTTQAMENGETERVTVREEGRTQRAIVFAKLVDELFDDNGSTSSSGGPGGTNHQGGITAGFQAGVGVGWPVILLGMVGFFGLMYVLRVWNSRRG
jgi:hypothetical protein